MTNYLLLEFSSSNQQAIPFMLSGINALGEQMDLTLSKVRDIRTAVSEAVANACEFAYPNKPGKIKIHFDFSSDNLLQVKVIDEGCGITNVDQARNALFTTGEDNKHSGMGFTIMGGFTDSLVVESTPNGTTVILTFKIR